MSDAQRLILKVDGIESDSNTKFIQLLHNFSILFPLDRLKYNFVIPLIGYHVKCTNEDYPSWASSLKVRGSPTAMVVVGLPW